MSDLSEVYFAPDGARLLLGRSLASDIEVRLITAWPPAPPGRRLNVDDYPQPSQASGYAAKLVKAGAWQIRDVDGGVVAEAPMQIFSLRGGSTEVEIAGQMFVDKNSGQLLSAGRFRRPVPVPDDGMLELEIVPRYFQAASPVAVR